MTKNENLAHNTLRFLSADAIQKANSGHPGLPMGMANPTFDLWAKVLNHNPQNPDWVNRDRFILSAGHGSALLYSLMHMFGYDVSMEDLQNFRQFGSKTAGHPEYTHIKGIEATTGPLGQGIAMAVGMAMGEKIVSEKFNKDDIKLIDHNIYALCGDGCMQEGISHESASLAGSLELGKLVVIYDSNNITIEGDTDVVFNEDVKARFDAYNWHTILVDDANDSEAFLKAIEEAKANEKQPSLVIVKSTIGFGSPNKAGKSSAHGEPLGVDEIKLAKESLGFPYPDNFAFPEEVKTYMEEVKGSLAVKEDEWKILEAKYKEQYPNEYNDFVSFNNNELPNLLDNEDFWTYEGDIATRVSSSKVLNKLKDLVPNLVGGSADLAPSTKTVMEGLDFFTREHTGRNLHFGVRELGMTAMANGLALYGGLIPYVSGFFVFSDYMKPAMRLSAIMGLRVINILTHDSIGVGEDGPTHQPVEQLAMLRSTPNLTVFRPCDTKETAAAWYLSLTRNNPSALVLTRQNLPLLKETGKNALKGGYIVRDTSGTPDIILIASGSEVSLSYKAAEELEKEGIKARVVSMLSLEIFEEQDEAYKQSVLPKEVTKRVFAEAGSSYGLHKYIGFEGKTLTIDTFGASGPANLVFDDFGFTVENLVKIAKSL
ncbi:MAG: transketolase [Lachnospirales bacterium]